MKKKIPNSIPNTAPLLDKEGCPVAKRDGVVEDGVVEEAIFSPSLHSLPHLKNFRTELRNTLTPAEAFLWKAIQNSKLEGKKFRRQHSIGNFIVDFYCPSEQLAIELDGNAHYNETAQDYDEKRDSFISQSNIRVLRFENKQVFDNLDGVLKEIKKCFRT